MGDPKGPLDKKEWSGLAQSIWNTAPDVIYSAFFLLTGFFNAGNIVHKNYRIGNTIRNLCFDPTTGKRRPLQILEKTGGDGVPNFEAEGSAFQTPAQMEEFARNQAERFRDDFCKEMF